MKHVARFEHVSDGYSIMSVVLGSIGALLTALVHLQIATSSHFDFLQRDEEFYLVLGVVAFVAALVIGDLGAGMFALKHLKEPHARYTKSAALAGIGLGVFDLLPALIILAIMLETSILKWLQAGPMIR